MAYDSKSYDLAEHFLLDHPTATIKDAENLAQFVQEMVEDWIRAELPEEVPEPCTEAAYRAGCTCHLSSVNSVTIDPPEPVLDRACPLHGVEHGE